VHTSRRLEDVLFTSVQIGASFPDACTGLRLPLLLLGQGGKKGNKKKKIKKIEE
jgi:hypothetical protein